MKHLLIAVLAATLLSAAPARDSGQGGPAHVETVSVVQSDWVQSGEVVTITQECGDVTVFARDGRSLRDSGFYFSTGTVGSSDEVCHVSWQSGQLTVEVNVVKKWGESEAEWAQRCADRAAALQVKFPPNPPQ